MGKLPGFIFYSGDWLKDPELRRCSKAAKGVWIDMLAMMFECADRGVLSTGGEPWSDHEIAAAIGGDISENLSCLEELLRKGVARRNGSGAIFCARMVRDQQTRIGNKERKQKERSVTHDVTPLVTRSVTPLSVNETETEKKSVIPEVRFKIEEAPDLQLHFDALCLIYPKAERGHAAQLAYVQSVEWVARHKQISHREAVAYVYQRAEAYVRICKFQKGLYKWLDEKIFEQKDSAWSDGGIVNGSNQPGGATPISRQAARNESNREKLAKRILGVDVSRDAATGGSQREVRIDGQRNRVLEAPGGRIPGGND